MPTTCDAPPPHTRVEDVCLATPFSPHENDETGKGVTKSGRPLKDAQKTSKKKHTQRQREKTLETARRRKRRRRRRDQRERSLAKRDEEERNRESERPKSDDDDDDDDDERYISHSFVASVFFFRYN